MEAMRTWTLKGDNPMTVALYKPVMTIRFGDGPETHLSPSQVAELSSRLCDVESYFDAEDPEDL